MIDCCLRSSEGEGAGGEEREQVAQVFFFKKNNTVALIYHIFSAPTEKQMQKQ